MTLPYNTHTIHIHYKYNKKDTPGAFGLGGVRLQISQQRRAAERSDVRA